MYGIAYGFAEIISGNVPIANLPKMVGFIGNGYLLYYLPGKALTWLSPPQGISRAEIRELIPLIPNVFFFALLVVLVFAFLLSRTQFGQHTYAIGGNIDAARRAGINVERHLIKVYMISSFLSGLSGIMSIFIFSIGTHTQFASSLELFAIAAVVIGGASLMGGKGSIAKTVVGVFILSVLEVGFLTSGIMPFYRYIAVGAILIFAVIVDQILPELGFE
jgi:ribose transport system permease protein